MSADLWIESAAPQLGGCPLITLRAEWLNAAREFFTRSTCWREDLPVIAIVGGTAQYIVTPPVADCKINYIHQVAIPTAILSPSSQVPKVLATQEGDVPTQYATPQPDTLVLYPTPQKDNTMIVTASLVPTAVDTVMPDYIQVQYFEVLLDGLLGRLMNYKNKPYSNPDGAEYHLRRFRSGMARVRNNTIHGLNESANTWGFPQGFANGRF